MKKPDERDLIAKALRDELSEAEKREWQQLLEDEPALRGEYAEELALEKALDQLPNVKISTNFTALVLQEAHRSGESRSFWSGLFRFRFPAFAQAAAVFGVIATVGLALGYRYRKTERADMALGVRSFTEVAAAIGSSHGPAADVFANFDAIQRLSMPTDNEVDLELLVALQK